MSKQKRYRIRKVKPGELKAQYGKLPYDEPDIILSWGGEGANKRDSAMLWGFLNHTRIDGRSLLEELAIRDYDLTTFKFSVQKRKS